MSPSLGPSTGPRLRRWFSQRPTEKDLVAPVRDDVLALEMKAIAERFVSDRVDLDFTVDALEKVSLQVRAANADELSAIAAFTGEVIVRLRSETYWGRSPRGRKIGVGIGVWFADPEEWLRQMRSDSRYPDNHLADTVQEMLLLADDPASALDDAEFIEGKTALEFMRDRVRRWRQRG